MHSIKKPSSGYILRNGAFMFYDPATHKTKVLSSKDNLTAPLSAIVRADGNPNTVARITNIRYK